MTFDDDDEDDDFLLEEVEDWAAAASVRAPPDARAGRAVANVTVGDADALECGVCFLALRPPIFQCEVGHVVCSVCRDKLEATGNGKCHVCRRAATPGGGYRRCHAMERLVDCINVPCPYAAHGCRATPPYHGKESHRQMCPHAPCHCPGESCRFIGSTAALLEHFTGAHNWPCTTRASAGETFSIHLLVGFNFFLLAVGQDRLLFLVNVTQERLGRAISLLCIRPHANIVDQPPSMVCRLSFAHDAGSFAHSGDASLCRTHCQSSEFRVACTDLSNGLPSPDGCFQFIVPNAVLGDNNKDYVEHASTLCWVASACLLGQSYFFTEVNADMRGWSSRTCQILATAVPSCCSCATVYSCIILSLFPELYMGVSCSSVNHDSK